MTAPEPRAVTRWVAGVARIDLIHAIHTADKADGWRLVIRHAVSGVVIHEEPYPWLDSPDPALRATAEAALTAALEGVAAVPVIRPKRKRASE